jgi:hypothetical protein
MVRVMRFLTLVFVAAVVLFSQEPSAFARRQVPTTLEPLVAAAPSYRIDDQIRRISIVGSGPGSGEIESGLTRLFMDRTDITVIEPANLRSVMAGRAIEYRTGIAPEDAQTLSRMLQIDHIVLFDVEMAPHSAYKFGGRSYARISLKIVDTRNGEVLLQLMRNVGIHIEDPRKYGYTHNLERDAPELRNGAMRSLVYELRYALGDVAVGWHGKTGTNVLTYVLVGSAADTAGLQAGDIIVGINDAKVSSEREIAAFFGRGKNKQGDEIVVKIERDGKTMERRMKFPLIPFRSGKKGDKLRDQGPVEEPQKEAPKTAIF